MSRDVKAPRRAYDSTRRQEQARQTRWTVIQAARQLFLEHGFSATTMPAIAGQAGVSVQMVYKSFANKAGLAKAVFDAAIAGDDDARPIRERRSLTEVRVEPDPRRKLILYGRFLSTVAPRHVPIQLLLRAAAETDADATAVWRQLQQERLDGMTLFANHLRDQGHLRADVSARHARDILWTYNSAEMYELLVLERGWSAKKYGEWIGQQLIAALLDPNRGQDRVRQPFRS
jgi:AcrR family transcriptional regulator